MSDVGRWVVGIVVVLVLIGLLAIARGPAHHRGNELGLRPPATPTLVVVNP